MKSDVMPSLVRMDADDLRKLTAEVKETVATDVQLPNTTNRTLTLADLWNIRRNAKSATTMMRR